MNNEYIRKHDVLVALMDNDLDHIQAPNGKEAVQILSDIPAADVVPVRLGEWLDGYKMQICSLCKCKGKKSWTFCPYCGARMIYGDRKKDKS